MQSEDCEKSDTDSSATRNVYPADVGIRRKNNIVRYYSALKNE